MRDDNFPGMREVEAEEERGKRMNELGVERRVIFDWWFKLSSKCKKPHTFVALIPGNDVEQDRKYSLSTYIASNFQPAKYFLIKSPIILT